MPWWQTAVFYQIYPRSFLDTDGDGVGDLEGIRRRLDHLVWLGVDAVWISPFFRSPMKDYGYDVSDYCDVDPLFGTLADFDRLLAEAHARGLRVIIDWVPNHTSDQHPWFREARASRSSRKRDWYVWRDGTPDRPPEQLAGRVSEGPRLDAGTRPPGSGICASSLPEQPDLNWDNPEVRGGDARHAALLARSRRRRLPDGRDPLHRKGSGAPRRSGRARDHPGLRAQRRRVDARAAARDPPPARCLSRASA